MKKIILMLMTMFMLNCTCVGAFATEQEDAVAFFNSYVTAANTYDAKITSMYSPDAKIIRQVVKPDGTTQDVVTDTKTYIHQMKMGQAGAKLRHYTNAYSDITSEKVVDGEYKISSLRQPSGEDYKLEGYSVVKKQADGSWLIVEEMMQTKVQMLLKYAK